MRCCALYGVVCLWMLSAAGCGDDATPHAGCDVDGDCAMGHYCGAGGCRADCREMRDCAAMGASAVCTARGRCTIAMDAGMDGATAAMCTTVEDCTNDVFCDGIEYCNALDSAADGRGCVHAPAPCATADCDEAADTCDPCRDPDEDRDGYDDVACPGGTDCDDRNARVNSGAPEVCDMANTDEDCAPRTLGARSQDQDGDGFWPAATEDGTPCCNGDVCGTDCADIPGVDVAAPDRFPGARETCNELDDNCDGRVDEGVQELFYKDADCDGYGIAIPEPTRERDGSLPPEVAAYARLGCASAFGTIVCSPTTPGWVRDHRDCNDTNWDIAPGRVDTCTAPPVDEDCDGTPNDGCGCTIGTTARCGPATDAGECTYGTALCIPPGVTSPVCDGAVLPATETCLGAGRGRDEDCDGMIDEGLINACGQCTESLPAEVCNGTDDNCDGVADPVCRLGSTRACPADYGCGRQYEQRCIGVGTPSCAWEGGGMWPSCTAVARTWSYTGQEMGHACGTASGASWWGTRSPCRNFCQGPYITDIPTGVPMRASFYFNTGRVPPGGNCADIQLEVFDLSRLTLIASGSPTTVCGIGSVTIDFMVGTGWVSSCPIVELYVHVNRLDTGLTLYNTNVYFTTR